MAYKEEKKQLSNQEQKCLRKYVEEEGYKAYAARIAEEDFAPPAPRAVELNKLGTRKKRIVYAYPDDFLWLLKFIAWQLYRYDGRFAANCYAFRRGYGVGDAVANLKAAKGIEDMYCLKLDIRDYFHSINVHILLDKLDFVKEDDPGLYGLIEKLLMQDPSRGAIAGMPLAPFLANVYLMDVDHFFADRAVLYFRYSDDMLLFADTKEELKIRRDKLYAYLAQVGLTLNEDKLTLYHPSEAIDFLGFRFSGAGVDISEAAKRKLKGKIRRKAEALRRWCRKKKLPAERGAKGFVRAMNKKLYSEADDTGFTWSRYFFPYLTTAAGLKELDAYMQEYIRYCISGRHYKGNYRITYEELKELGYRSLVHEWYKERSAR